MVYNSQPDYWGEATGGGRLETMCYFLMAWLVMEGENECSILTETPYATSFDAMISRLRLVLTISRLETTVEGNIECSVT